MNKGWFYLLLAGISEIIWAYGLKMSYGFTDLWWSVFTIIVVFISFLFFSFSLKTISMGTAYAVFTGIGTAGAAIIGVFFLKEDANLLKFISLTVLIVGIIGLKMIDKQDKVNQEND